MSQNRKTVVVCRPDQYVSAPAYTLMETLKDKTSIGNREKFEEFAKLILGLSVIELFEIKRRIRRNFNFFEQAASKNYEVLRYGIPSKQELDYQEISFLKDIYKLLTVARFQVLTQEEWITAQEEAFDVRLPVDVRWDNLDNKLLLRFQKEIQEATSSEHELCKDIRQTNNFEHADRMMIFHRGYGLSKKQDLFINDKLDLLVEYLLYNPAMNLYKWYKGQVIQSKSPGQRELGTNVSLGRTQKPHHKARRIERKTLKQALPTPGQVLLKFHQKIEIQEPTFKDIVILYRRKVPKPSEQVKKQDVDASRRHRFVRRNMTIKSFSELAMADLEVVFPDKKVSLKPLAFLQLVITFVMAVIAALASLVTGVDLWAAFSIICAAGGRIAQVYSSMQYQMTEMTKIIAMKQYDISLDAQEGAIFKIMDEVGEQKYKELLLAYTILFLKGEGMSAEQLDDACEEFLEVQFQQKVAFQMRDVLPRLLKYELVFQDIEDKLHPIDLDEACQKLTKRWTEAFNLNEDEYRSQNISDITWSTSLHLKAPQSSSSGQESTQKGILGGVPAGIKKALVGTPISSQMEEFEEIEIDINKPKKKQRKWIFLKRKSE